MIVLPSWEALSADPFTAYVDPVELDTEPDCSAPLRTIVEPALGALCVAEAEAEACDCSTALAEDVADAALTPSDVEDVAVRVLEENAEPVDCAAFADSDGVAVTVTTTVLTTTEVVTDSEAPASDWEVAVDEAALAELDVAGTPTVLEDTLAIRPRLPVEER